MIDRKNTQILIEKNGTWTDKSFFVKSVYLKNNSLYEVVFLLTNTHHTNITKTALKFEKQLKPSTQKNTGFQLTAKSKKTLKKLLFLNHITTFIFKT